MSDYTPTTDDVREDYAIGRNEIVGAGWYATHREEFDRWLARYRESVIDEVEDHLVRRDQFTERTLDVIDELRDKK